MVMDRLVALERKGIWWDVAESAARTDLELIEGSLRPGEDVDQAVDGFERLFLDEKEVARVVDPTQPARSAYKLIDEHLEPGETRDEAVAAYRRLWQATHERRWDDTPEHPTAWTTRERYELIADCKLPDESRMHAVEDFLADRRGFEPRKLQERLRSTRTEARLGELDGYLVVGSVRVPKRHGC